MAAPSSRYGRRFPANIRRRGKLADATSRHFLTQSRIATASIFRYVARAASPDIAASFTEAIAAYCLKLNTFSHRGTKRDDIRPGLRTIGFRRTVTITFCVEPEEVLILGIFYGGQNFEDRLSRWVSQPD